MPTPAPGSQPLRTCPSQKQVRDQHDQRQDDRRQQASPHPAACRQLHVETTLGDIPRHQPSPRRRAHEKQARRLRRLQPQDAPPGSNASAAGTTNLARASPAQCCHSIRPNRTTTSLGRRLIPTGTISQNTAAGTISFLCGHSPPVSGSGNADSFQGVILSEVAPTPVFC